MDKTLLRLLCFDKSPAVAGMALIQLVQRTEKNGPFKFVVPEAELDALIETVHKAPLGEAGEVVRVLGMCAENGVDVRFDPILDRLISEVKSTGECPRTKDSYLSPRVYMLNQYLITFRDMGQVTWEPLRKAIDKARGARDAETEKWLCLSAGYAADHTVADYLKELVVHEPDRYVRCVAIRAYTKSAGREAMALLRTLVDDTTPSEFASRPMNMPYYLIGWTAEEGISMLDGNLGTP